MCLNLLQDGQLYALLFEVDTSTAEAFHLAACPREDSARKDCTGVLHCGHFERKPKAVPEHVYQENPRWCKRFSYCCSREGCRHRVTPASVRFLGRKVYVGVAVVVISAMCQGLTPARAKLLCETLELKRLPIERWRLWWRQSFVQSQCWKELRAQVAPGIDEQQLPMSLWVCYGKGVQALVNLMRGLSVLSCFCGWQHDP